MSVGIPDLLRLFPALSLSSPEIRISDSLIFFRYAFEFAMELVSRERFIPALDEEQGGIGNWAALIKGEDHSRLEQLAVCMPLVCGSFAESRTDFPDSSYQVHPCGCELPGC
ncbi:hypothetical protein [uncultured Methanospirillum sp.]|uniref:hypothetical protein n=1 Tax=uncultured Methanospirillum sp. TaxID=262503 RepID=UPI0029C97108|nr:hypothetical protein [uncultured Methanospirillum sp.]